MTEVARARTVLVSSVQRQQYDATLLGQERAQAAERGSETAADTEEEPESSVLDDLASVVQKRNLARPARRRRRIFWRSVMGATALLVLLGAIGVWLTYPAQPQLAQQNTNGSADGAGAPGAATRSSKLAAIAGASPSSQTAMLPTQPVKSAVTSVQPAAEIAAARKNIFDMDDEPSKASVVPGSVIQPSVQPASQASTPPASTEPEASEDRPVPTEAASNIAPPSFGPPVSHLSNGFMVQTFSSPLVWCPGESDWPLYELKLNGPASYPLGFAFPFVVWSPPGSICIQDLRAGSRTVILGAALTAWQGQAAAQIFNSSVAFCAGRSLYLYDITTGKIVSVADQSDGTFKISDGVLAYVKSNDVYAYDLTSRKTKRLSNSEGEPKHDLVIGKRHVSWIQSHPPDSRLMSFDLNSGLVSQIGDNEAGLASLAAGGDVVTWFTMKPSEGLAGYFHDFQTDATVTLPNQKSRLGFTLMTDGKRVVWAASTATAGQYAIFSMDVGSRAVRKLGESRTNIAALGSGVVAWREYETDANHRIENAKVTVFDDHPVAHFEQGAHQGGQLLVSHSAVLWGAEADADGDDNDMSLWIAAPPALGTLPAVEPAAPPELKDFTVETSTTQPILRADGIGGGDAGWQVGEIKLDSTGTLAPKLAFPYVAWSAEGKILVHDWESGSRTVLAAPEHEPPSHPRLWGNWLAFREGPALDLLNLATHTVSQVAGEVEGEWCIADGLLAYIVDDDVYVYDLQSAQVARATVDALPKRSLVAANGRVLWLTANNQIKVYDRATKRVGNVDDGGRRAINLTACGDLAAWASPPTFGSPRMQPGGIGFHDFRKNNTGTLPASAGRMFGPFSRLPTTDGERIVVDVPVVSNGIVSHQLLAWNCRTKEMTDICNTRSTKTETAISEELVAWGESDPMGLGRQFHDPRMAIYDGQHTVRLDCQTLEMPAPLVSKRAVLWWGHDAEGGQPAGAQCLRIAIAPSPTGGPSSAPAAQAANPPAGP